MQYGGGSVDIAFSGGYEKLKKEDLTMEKLENFTRSLGGFAKIWKEIIHNKSYKNLIILPVDDFTESENSLKLKEYEEYISNSLTNIFLYGINKTSELMSEKVNNRMKFYTIAPNANIQIIKMN